MLFARSSPPRDLMGLRCFSTVQRFPLVPSAVNDIVRGILRALSASAAKLFAESLALEFAFDTGDSGNGLCTGAVQAIAERIGRHFGVRGRASWEADA